MAKITSVRTRPVSISKPQQPEVSKKVGNYRGLPVQKASKKNNSVSIISSSVMSQHRKIKIQQAKNTFQTMIMEAKETVQKRIVSLEKSLQLSITEANRLVKNGVKTANHITQETFASLKDMGNRLKGEFETARKIISQATQNIEKQLQTQKATEIQRQIDIKNLSERIRQSGLSQIESNKLQDYISSLSGKEQSREIQFLKEIVQSPNVSRALKTYLSLCDVENSNPARITRDIVHTLTRGVSEPRTIATAGREGILGMKEALDAADALIKMPQSEYQRLINLLHRAGQSDKGTVPPKSDAQTERILILNAVSARKDELSNPSLWNRIRIQVGYPSTYMRDIEQYAAQIRSRPREELIRRSTVLDVDGDAQAEALQQRFTTSCTPTAQQMARAEADPIYAWQLHEEAIHSLQSQGNIANEQRRLLTTHGGIAVARQGVEQSGVGMWPERTLDTFVGRYSNETYVRCDIPNSVNSRSDALNRIDPLLEGGTDVPIVVAWNNGGSHSMLITDVRGSGNEREYLVSDPWTGRTDWIKKQNIINGNTDFFAGNGRLWITYE